MQKHINTAYTHTEMDHFNVLLNIISHKMLLSHKTLSRAHSDITSSSKIHDSIPAAQVYGQGEEKKTVDPSGG